MRSPDEVTKQVRRRYRSVWRDALIGDRNGPYLFPLGHPTAAAITEHPEQVAAWLTRWRAWAIDTPSAQLRTRLVHTTYGHQPVYTHLAVEDATDLAGLNQDTSEHWIRACSRTDALRRTGVDLPAVRSELGALIELPDPDFATLLSAVEWFRTHPRSGLTVRSVPVPRMHTKWLASHRALVLACLSLCTTSPGDDLSALELDSLGLRITSPEISIILASPDLQAVTGGLRQVTAPIHEIAALPLKPGTALIIENKQPALAWPDTAGLVIIHSLGNHLEILQQLPWLPSRQTWYWGDLDRHGFTILSRARDLLPHLRSLMMRPTDVAHYAHLSVTERLARHDSPADTLTEAETHAMSLLSQDGGYLRIEQERLPILEVVSQFDAS